MCSLQCLAFRVAHVAETKGFFFSGFVACLVSVRDLFVLLWFCTICEEKGVTVCGRFLESFHPRNFFCNLTRDECLETKEKMARWDSDDDFSPRGPTFCEIFLAIILPPIGVFLKYGCAVSLPNFCFLLFFLFALPFRLSFHCFRFFSAVYPDSSSLEE